MIHRTGISVTQVQVNQFEYMDCRVKVNDISVRISVIYRPPPSQANGLKNIVFLTEWASYPERLTEIHEEILITGDFNFHMDNRNDTDASRFSNLLDAHGLTQHVKEPTHKKGHILDLVITRDTSLLLNSSPVVTDPGLCDSHGNPSGDHFALVFCINIQ